MKSLVSKMLQWLLTTAETARKINNIFGRDIANDVEAFRWVSNLENIHFIMKDKNDAHFFKDFKRCK